MRPSIIFINCIVLFQVSCSTVYRNPISDWITSAYKTLAKSPEEIHADIGALDSLGKLLPYDPACDEDLYGAYFTSSNSSIATWIDLHRLWMIPVQKNFTETRDLLEHNLSRCVRNPYKYIEKQR